MYLRELPIPLVTFDAYTEVMKATSKQKERVGREMGGGKEEREREWKKEEEREREREGNMAGIAHISSSFCRLHL